MSYEGYDEYLCTRGHLRVFDCRDDSKGLCSCGAELVFVHAVDETNCDGEPTTFVVKTPAVFKVCDLGHTHMIEEPTYEFPR